MGTKKDQKVGWFGRILASHGFKQFMSKTYGIGAAIVLVGAMFKINHFPGANIMLIAGLGVEAFIFFMSAFEPLHEEVDWSLVYPELAGDEPVAGIAAGASVARIAAPRYTDEEGRILSEKLDQMLHSAKIDSNLMNSLSEGLGKLNETAKNMNASTDIINVNTTYADELSKLTTNLGRLNNVYVEQLDASSRQIEAAAKAQENMSIIAKASENTNYPEELSKLTENLGRLNTLYMQQFEASALQMEATAKAQENMNRIAETLSGALENSTRYKDEISELSEKVNSLNKVYGGMLSAFKGVGQ